MRLERCHCSCRFVLDLLTSRFCQDLGRASACAVRLLRRLVTKQMIVSCATSLTEYLLPSSVSPTVPSCLALIFALVMLSSIVPTATALRNRRAAGARHVGPQRNPFGGEDEGCHLARPFWGGCRKKKSKNHKTPPTTPPAR